MTEAAVNARLVTVSPHRREGESVPLVMWTVVLALLPAGAVAVYIFGWRALYVTALAAASCVVTEAIVQKLRGVRITVGDGSAAVTGVLLAFVLPPSVAWYVPVVGGVVAIGLAKQAFGGLGANFFNPALVARAFLQFAFPTQVSLGKWPMLVEGVRGFGSIAHDCGFDAVTGATGMDAVAGATPLALLAENPGMPWSEIDGPYALFGAPIVWLLPTAAAVALFALLVIGAGIGIYLAITRRAWWARLAAVGGVGAVLLLGMVPTGEISFGRIPGCIGETGAWALLLGGLALVYYRCVNWELPAAYIATLAVLVLVLPVSVTTTVDGVEKTALVTGFAAPGRVLVHVFAGGLFLGAFFMITDMVTSPITVRGQVIFGVLAGVLVAVIRVYGAYPEGVCYSILLANAARPLIDKYTVPRVFGARRAVAKAAA
ncbi:MAG: RnfABCDGE type electron transport complex subunit D [Planctomycetota bacterium]|jgi:electron transport complex protein RnfD